MKPEAQPRPRQDSQQHKDVLGRTTPHPKGDRADSAFQHDSFSGPPADTGQVNHTTTRENAPAASCGAGLEAWRGSSIAMPGGMSVNRPS